MVGAAADDDEGRDEDDDEVVGDVVGDEVGDEGLVEPEDARLSTLAFQSIMRRTKARALPRWQRTPQMVRGPVAKYSSQRL